MLSVSGRHRWKVRTFEFLEKEPPESQLLLMVHLPNDFEFIIENVSVLLCYFVVYFEYVFSIESKLMMKRYPKNRDCWLLDLLFIPSYPRSVCREIAHG